MTIYNRFPKWPQVAAVYSVIVLIVYAWTTLAFFWKLPSWLYFLSIWEIIKIFCYVNATNFLESLVVLALPLLLALILPKKWFRDGFVSRSITMLLIGLSYMMYLANLIQNKNDYPVDAIRRAPIILAVIVLAVFLVGKIPLLCKVIDGFADRSTIFLYISIPISLICLLVVLVQLVV